MAVAAPDKNKKQMDYGDLVYCFEKMLGMFYIRTNLVKIMAHYGGEKGNRTALVADMTELMEKGQESDTWKYWEGTQTLLDHMATGRTT